MVKQYTMSQNTVFQRIVSAETIIFWKLGCDNYSMVPIKRTVFLLTVYGMKNMVRLIGTLE